MKARYRIIMPIKISLVSIIIYYKYWLKSKIKVSCVSQTKKRNYACTKKLDNNFEMFQKNILCWLQSELSKIDFRAYLLIIFKALARFTKNIFNVNFKLLWKSLILACAKGKLISKANLKVFIWTKNQRKCFCISALASKNP